MITLNKILTPQIIREIVKVNTLRLTVNGISMCPLILPGDIVVISASKEYKPSDILLYPYKNEGLLLHRLLKVNERLFCKGDNAFRMEDISIDDVIGKVIGLQRNGKTLPLPIIDEAAIELSMQISKDFSKEKYNKQTTMQHKTYSAFVTYLRELCYEKDN